MVEKELSLTDRPSHTHLRAFVLQMGNLSFFDMPSSAIRSRLPLTIVKFLLLYNPTSLELNMSAKNLQIVKDELMNFQFELIEHRVVVQKFV